MVNHSCEQWSLGDHVAWASLAERRNMSSEFEEMVNFLDLSYKARGYIVPCMIGPVGIGKTEAVLKHAENVGAKNVVTIIVSQILPNEVSGITMPDSDTKAMEIYDHYKLGHLEDGDILFFDELLEGDQMVMSACLTLIESRQLMSGKKLPDIQIVAACNPTIQPNMLKPSIRQRFMFRSFRIDKDGTRKYLLDKFGVDVGNLVDKLVDNGDDYNFLSPRSLTKLVQWMVESDKDNRYAVAGVINSIWRNDIGSKLFAIVSQVPSKQEQIRRVLKTEVEKNYSSATPAVDVVLKMLESSEDFDLIKVIDILKQTLEWKEIEKKLSECTFEEEEVIEEIEF